MIRTLFLIAAWSALTAIAVVTLVPLGLRPMVTQDPSYERFVAYAVLGLLFSLAYPRRLVIVIALVVGAAIVFESLQHLTASRHGEWTDLAQKASGGLAGIALSMIAVRRWPQLFGR